MLGGAEVSEMAKVGGRVPGEAQVCSEWRALHDADLHTLTMRFEYVEKLPALGSRFPNVRPTGHNLSRT